MFRSVSLFMLLCLASSRAICGGLDVELQDLKLQALALESDVLILQEQLEHPLTIYLSMDADARFKLDTLDILLDGKPLRSIEYDSQSIAGLRRGGAQRVFRGEVAEGSHELIAYYRSNRSYQRGARMRFEKTLKPQFMEIVISREEGVDTRLKPKLEIRLWDQFR